MTEIFAELKKLKTWIWCFLLQARQKDNVAFSHVFEKGEILPLLYLQCNSIELLRYLHHYLQLFSYKGCVKVPTGLTQLILCSQ